MGYHEPLYLSTCHGFYSTKLLVKVIFIFRVFFIGYGTGTTLALHYFCLDKHYLIWTFPQTHFAKRLSSFTSHFALYFSYPCIFTSTVLFTRNINISPVGASDDHSKVLL